MNENAADAQRKLWKKVVFLLRAINGRMTDEGTYKVEHGHQQSDEHTDNDHKQPQHRPGGDTAGQPRYPLDTHRHLGTPFL